MVGGPSPPTPPRVTGGSSPAAVVEVLVELAGTVEEVEVEEVVEPGTVVEEVVSGSSPSVVGGPDEGAVVVVTTGETRSGAVVVVVLVDGTGGVGTVEVVVDVVEVVVVGAVVEVVVVEVVVVGGGLVTTKVAVALPSAARAATSWGPGSPSDPRGTATEAVKLPATGLTILSVARPSQTMATWSAPRNPVPLTWKAEPASPRLGSRTMPWAWPRAGQGRVAERTRQTATAASLRMMSDSPRRRTDPPTSSLPVTQGKGRAGEAQSVGPSGPVGELEAVR